MIAWYLFYLVFVIGGIFLFVRLTMPAHLRTIKITANGLAEAFEKQAAEQKATWDSIKEQLQDRRKPR